MYLTVVVERFIRTLNNKIYKHFISISRNVHIDKFNDILNEYNNVYHRTLKMKPIDIKDNTHIDCIKEVNDKDPKFKVSDQVKIAKSQNIFAKRYTPKWFEEIFVIKKVKNAIP